MKQVAFIIALAALTLTSCKKELPEVGGTAAQKVANEWWVTFTDNGTDLYHMGHVKLSTYNTAANTGEIWIDDLENIWAFKVKAQVDYNNLTFSATQQQNQYYDMKVDILDGKVLPGAGRSKSGNVTDSIYMKVKFSDDTDAKTYTISGHARTLFAEDEY